MAEPSEEDLATAAAAEAQELLESPAKSAAAGPSSTPVEELSGDSDGFEDLGKDQETIQLRKRSAREAVPAAAAAAAVPAGRGGKKGQ